MVCPLPLPEGSSTQGSPVCVHTLAHVYTVSAPSHVNSRRRAAGAAASGMGRGGLGLQAPQGRQDLERGCAGRGWLAGGGLRLPSILGGGVVLGQRGYTVRGVKARRNTALQGPSCAEPLDREEPGCDGFPFAGWRLSFHQQCYERKSTLVSIPGKCWLPGEFWR